PVHGEHSLQRDDDGAGELHHVVHPRAVGGFILALNQVQGTNKAAVTVDDENLAVIVDIRAANAEHVNLQWQHQPPVHVNGAEPFAQSAIALVFEAADLIEEELYSHAALAGAR